MESEILLRQIAEDVAVIKKEISQIKQDIEEIDFDRREVKPEYAEKIKGIEDGVFLSEKEFEKELGL